MEFNKIFAAILVAGITASLSGFIAQGLTHAEPLEKDAVAVEAAGEAGGAGSAAKPAGPEPVLALIAGADPAKGETVARACAACHSFEKGGPNQTGPGLWGIVGRAKASHEGFSYSDGMKAAGGVWSYEDLNHFLWKPKAFLKDTKMTFIGVKKPEDRAALIAWLRTKADSPAPLPSDADIAAEQAALAPPAETAPAAETAAPAPH